MSLCLHTDRQAQLDRRIRGQMSIYVLPTTPHESLYLHMLGVYASPVT